MLTRSHAELQRGFSALPGKYFLENLKNVANDGTFPMFQGIINSLVVSACSAALCTYFSSLTAYGLYAYDFKMKKAAFTFIMAILVMPTQVTAMGFLRLITNMGMYDSLLPLIIPSIASPSVFYFMYSYLESSLPLSLVEAARIDGSGEFKTFNKIVLPIMKTGYCCFRAIFTFVGSWNNYFVPALVIQSKDKMTVPILIATLRGADYMNFDMGKNIHDDHSGHCSDHSCIPDLIQIHYRRCNLRRCKRIRNQKHMKNVIGHSLYAVSGKLWRFSSIITITNRERKTMTAGNWTYSGKLWIISLPREKRNTGYWRERLRRKELFF